MHIIDKHVRKAKGNFSESKGRIEKILKRGWGVGCRVLFFHPVIFLLEKKILNATRVLFNRNCWSVFP
jgi:hypothetical protein